MSLMMSGVITFINLGVVDHFVMFCSRHSSRPLPQPFLVC
ncbi:MAG: DUF2798 domain-containing protein [Desulfocapsaceae bacterium]